MKNILVPIDFSKSSHNASKYAIALAKHFDAEVIFINIIQPLMIVNDSVLAFGTTTQAERINNNQKLMKREIRGFSNDYPGKITGLVKEGSILPIIREICKLKNASLIVMGMKGKGKSNSVFGSTTTTMIRKLSIPVFVIPDRAIFKTINHITLASDFEDGIEMEKYAALLDIAERFSPEIHVLNVQGESAILDTARAIGKMETSRVFSKHKHQFHSISDRNVEEGIQKFIKRYSTDILVMIAHRHNLLERLFGTVHSSNMSYLTKIPLLVLQNK